MNASTGWIAHLPEVSRDSTERIIAAEAEAVRAIDAAEAQRAKAIADAEALARSHWSADEIARAKARFAAGG